MERLGKRHSVLWLLALVAIVNVTFALAARPIAQSAGKNVEWPVYWGDNRSAKYSPLDQINRDNVKDLRIAWRWSSQNLGVPYRKREPLRR